MRRAQQPSIIYNTTSLYTGKGRDITSLYTVIPNGEGLLALKHFFDLRTVKEASSETLLRLAELVLTLNCFSFADSYYK